MKKLSILAILLMTVSLNVFSARSTCTSVNGSTEELTCGAGTSLYVISENGQNKTVCLSDAQARDKGVFAR